MHFFLPFLLFLSLSSFPMCLFVCVCISPHAHTCLHACPRAMALKKTRGQPGGVSALLLTWVLRTGLLSPVLEAMLLATEALNDIRSFKQGQPKASQGGSPPVSHILRHQSERTWTSNKGRPGSGACFCLSPALVGG